MVRGIHHADLLKPGWTKHHDEQGHPFYYNQWSNKSFWEIPTESPTG